MAEWHRDLQPGGETEPNGGRALGLPTPFSAVRDVHTPLRSCLGMGGREDCPRCVVCPHNSWSLHTRSSAQRGLQSRCHPGCGRDESGSAGVSCVGPHCAQPCASRWQEKERPVLDTMSHWEAEEKGTLTGASLTLACQESPLNLSSLEVIISCRNIVLIWGCHVPQINEGCIIK